MTTLSYTRDTAELTEGVFQAFEKDWKEGEGMFCPGYSVQESERQRIVAGIAVNELGFQAFTDMSGNLVCIKEGTDPTLPVNLCGSHLDTVPAGGRYDGMAGVVMGLSAGKILQDAHIRPEQGFGFIAFRSEESPWFSNFGAGSKLATASTGSAFLDTKRSDSGQSLYHHMTELGMDPHGLALRLDQGLPSLPLHLINTYVESHIEQGRQLAGANKDVGIVTAIRGNVRFNGASALAFKGVAGHTGGVAHEDRVDAVVMGAQFIMDVARKVDEWNARGRDAVRAFPTAHTDVKRESLTTIADHFAVTAEIRSTDLRLLKEARDYMIEAARAAAAAQNGHVEFSQDAVILNKPAEMRPAIMRALEEAGEGMGISTMRLASGAGHDAGILALKGVPSGMLFIAHGNHGRSHVPDEVMGLNIHDGIREAVAPGSSFAKASLMTAAHFAKRNPDALRSNESFVPALIGMGGKKFII